MSEDEWQVPAPREDPEARKARAVRDGDGGARLVPREDFVEGEIAEEGETQPPGACPFPH